MERAYDLNETFGQGNNSDDDQELEHEDLLFGSNEDRPSFPTRDPPGQQVPNSTAQMPDSSNNQMLALVQSLIAENQRLSSESGKRSRAERDEEEEGEPPAKLHIPEGYDDAWTTISQASRNVRPYSGDWQTRFKSLTRRAKPVRDTLDWDPMGTITVANATVRRMHDRGAILTVKMFLPSNHDVSSREANISFKGKDGDFVRETLNYREPTETWQIVEGLQVYTMCLSRIWRDDWTGHALQNILTKYRWIANCGKPKATQVRLLIDFINNVLSTNATYGRQMRPPATYTKIEEIMANRIWSRGINRESCQTGRDPWSSTPDGSRIPKYTDGRVANSNGNTSNSKSQKPSGGKTPKTAKTNNGVKTKSQDNHCRGYNSSAGCSKTQGQCRFKHACNRSIDSNNFCNKTDHNADSHV